MSSSSHPFPLLLHWYAIFVTTDESKLTHLLAKAHNSHQSSLLVSFLLWLVCVHLCVYVFMCTYVCGGQKLAPGGFINPSLPYVLRKVSPLELELTNLVKVAGQGSSCLHFSMLGWQGMSLCLLLHGCWKANTGSHTCATSTLMT